MKTTTCPLEARNNVTQIPRRGQISPKTKFAFLIVGLIVVAQASAQGKAKPIVGKIFFEPVVINKIEANGVMYPIDEPKLRSELEVQFNKWIVRSVTKQHLASEAVSIENHSAGAGEYVLKTIFDIPLTHRADMSHWSNQLRRGKFMEYHLTLINSGGNEVAKVTGALTWGDGFWSQSRARRPADQAHNEVMKGYVRKAVDRGVASLKKALMAKATDGLDASFKHDQKSPPDSHVFSFLRVKRGQA